MTGAFQGRLAVGFDRLVFPDGRTVRMSFAGLNAIGESGLADEVDRHYVSTFGAVGAVGLLAGLVRGGGGDSYYDPVSQQFALTATQLFDRYMNRLPEITIRAGHPLRIWLTQDLIVPSRRRGPGEGALMMRMRLDDVLMLALAERVMETGHVLGAAFGARAVAFVWFFPRRAR